MDELAQANKRIAELEAKNSELTTNLSSQRQTHEAELRTEREAKEALAADLKTRDEQAAADLESYKTERFTKIAKGDQAVADKLKTAYEELAIDDSTRDGIDARALRAYQLATAVSADPMAARPEPELGGGINDDANKITPETKGEYLKMFPSSQAFQADSGATS